MGDRRRLQVLVLNQIAALGLKRLPAEMYSVGKDVVAPDAVLVRSADMHGMDDPVQRHGHRTGGRRHQQHPRRGDECARRPGVQHAGGQRQCRQGTRARRHADVGAQPSGGTALRGRRSSPMRPTWTARSKTARRRLPATNWPATPWASSASARSGAWWPMRPSSSACTCSATTPRSPSMPPGACRRRCRRPRAWPRCCVTATSSRCTCRWSTPRAAWSATTTSA